MDFFFPCLPKILTQTFVKVFILVNTAELRGKFLKLTHQKNNLDPI
ncbi:hypothetical protein QF042_001091 [Pedobacter sp. W3I1]|nr:hypothetical protein [Pedobacter sp. W3I1]